LLIDGRVDEFAIELPKYYAINDSLPRYFREAVSEMISDK
jgi:hypothetical protein